MTDQQTSELAEPSIGSLNDPAAFVAAQFATVMISPFLVVAPVWGDQFNAAPLPSFAQRIGVIATIGDHPLWLLPRPSFRSGDADLLLWRPPSVTTAGEALSIGFQAEYL